MLFHKRENDEISIATKMEKIIGEGRIALVLVASY